MQFLRQSTAATLTVGPFLDKADGLTPKTALADQSANARLSKAGTGGAFTASSWAHDALGHYAVGVSAGNTDTVGRLRLSFSDATTFVPVWEDFEVLAQVVYDVLFGTVAPSTYAGGAVASVTAGVTVTTNNDKTGYSLTQTFPTNFGSLAITVGGAVTAGTVSDKTGYSLTVTPPTAASIVTAMMTDVLSSTDFNTASSFGLLVKGVLTQLAGTFTTSSSSVFTTTALANAPTGGTAPTASAIATAVWQDTTAGDFTVVGSPGKALLTYLDAAVSTRSTYAGGAVASVTGPVTVGTNSDKTGYALTAGEHTNIITDVWTTAAARVLTAGTNIALAKGVGVTGFNDIAATAIVSGGAVTTSGGAVSTVTTLTNIPTAPTDWVSAAAVSAGAVTKVQAGLSTYAGGAVASVTAPVTVGTNNDKTGYTASTVGDKTGYGLAADGLDAVTAETGVNARQALALTLDAVLAKLTGNGGAAPLALTVRDVNDTADRAAFAVDASGNRGKPTLSPPP